VGGITRVHGQIFMRSGVAFMPCYHPAAALHNGSLLGDLQKDFDKVREYLDRLLTVPDATPPGPEPVSPRDEAAAKPEQPGAEQLPLI
jgi:DNA polymerase